MNKFLRNALISAVGGFFAFLIVERFTSARERGAFNAENFRLPEGTKTIFNATQEETILQ